MIDFLCIIEDNELMKPKNQTHFSNDTYKESSAIRNEKIRTFISSSGNLNLENLENILLFTFKKNWKKYENEFKRLSDKILKNPQHKLMFHITNRKSAREIAKNGFDISKSKLMAFGRGVNLCKDLQGVIKFHPMHASRKGLSTIIVCQVQIGKSHGNRSFDEQVVELPDGNIYSKPEFYKPKIGFDCMYSESPHKEIWIIPSSARVYPSFLIDIKL